MHAVSAARGFEEVAIAVGSGQTVPLLGTVAAGEPYRAFPVEDVLTVPGGMWGGRKVFALRVRGTSMIDEGIRDGDHLIVEPRETADPGQTVVAEVEGAVTVKRLFREVDGKIRLQPANPEMLPLVLAAGDVRVIGVVVGVVRRHGFQGPRRAPRAARPAAVDAQTLDLALRAIAQSLRDAEDMLRRKPPRTCARIEALARGLRSLRDCYLATTAPRLRQALLREAGDRMRRLKRFDV